MNETLVTRIQERMKALGLNPTSTAKKAGLERNFVLDIMKGRKEHPRLDSLQKLADALETSVQWLTGAPETAAAPRPRQPSSLTPFRSELIDLTLGMPEELAASLVVVARQMLDMHIQMQAARDKADSQSE